MILCPVVCSQIMVNPDLTSSLQMIVPAIWFLAIVFNLPLLLTIYYNKQSDFCMQYWPQQWMVKANAIVWFLTTGVIPIVLMTALYSRVVNALWFQNEDSSDNVRQVSSSFSERVVAKSTTNSISKIHLAL